MRNVAQVTELISHPDFRKTVGDRSAADLKYYNEKLGFNSFKDRISDLSETGSLAIFDLCDEFFSQERISKILAREQESADLNPFYGSSFQPLDSHFFAGIVLAATDRFTVLLMAVHGHEIEAAKRRQEGEKRTIAFAGNHTFLKIYNAHELSVRGWSVPSFSDEDDLVAMDLRPQMGRIKTLKDGDRCVFDPCESFEYLADCGAQALMLQVQMHEGGRPMTLEFDVDSGQLVGASAPSQEPTRLQMLTSALRMFGRTDAFDDVAELLEHPAHFVRWHAMRECIGINSTRALPHLLRLSKQDPQPAVRRAAQKTIDTFFVDDVVRLAS